MSTSDQTAVTGTPLGGAVGPKRGQVVGERYEVRGRLRDDPFSYGFLAFDQETEGSVFLRIVRPELLESTDRKQVVRDLRRSVGMGGKYLPGLLDADRDSMWVYATEPVPEGVSFRSVLDRRIHEDAPLTPEELLPVIAHLDAALTAIPPPLRHGDVRADAVWIDPERLQMTGAFLVPALPPGVVAAVLQRHGDLRRRYAPEVVRGVGSISADRYGVAAVAHEALTLKPPPDPGASVRPLGALTAALAALLHPDPRRRATSLEPLLEGLAKQAGLAVPELEPAPFKKARRFALRSSAPPDPDAKTDVRHAKAKRPARGATSDFDGESTAKEMEAPSAIAPPRLGGLLGASTDVMGPSLAADTEKMPAMDEDAAAEVLAAAARARARTKAAAAVAPDSETRRFPALDEGKRQKKRKKSAPPAEGLDPRLVRAAMAKTPDPGPLLGDSHSLDMGGVESDEEGGHILDGSPDSTEEALDPRLVRAALGITIEGSDEVPLDPSVPAKPAKDGTQELAFEDLEEDDDDEVPLDPSVPAKAAKEGTQEIGLDELEAMDSGADLHPPKPIASADDLSLEDLEAMERERRRAAVPEEAIKRLPRPRKDSGLQLQAVSLFDDSHGAGHPPAAAPTPAPVVDPARTSKRAVVQTPILSPDSLPPARPRVPRVTDDTPARILKGVEASKRPRSHVGMTLVFVALLMGILIVAGSFAYAAHKRNAVDEERRQRLQERFERLQQQQSTTP